MSQACASPLDVATLVDYWFDESADSDLDHIEEHLLGCDACSRRLQALATLGEGVRRVAREGRIQVLVAPSFLDTAAREGLKLREYRLAPGDRVACTITPEDDLVFARVTADFHGVSRLDLTASIDGGPEERIEDVPVGDDTRELVVLQSTPFLRGMKHEVMRMRLVSVEAGGDRLLGEYTFAHYSS